MLALPVVWGIGLCRWRIGMRVLEGLGILRPSAPEPGSARTRFLIAYVTKHIGDLVLMLPMIEALKRAHPDARLELAVQKSAASLLAAVPQVDRVWGLDVPGSGAKTRMEALRLSWDVTREYLKGMADEAPPAVCIVPRWGDDGLRSSDVAYLMRASRRIGFEMKLLSDRLPFGEGTMTEQVAGGHGMQEASRGLYLLQSAGLLGEDEVPGSSERVIASLRSIAERTDWNALADRVGLRPEERFGVIAPGATQARRRWPVDRWAEVGRLLQDAGLVVVVLSGADDAPVARALQELLQAAESRGRSVVVAGVTTIAETVTLLAHSEIFLGADSGPGHLAGGLGVPTVVQFIAAPGSDPDGSHSPERFRPVGPKVRCVQIPQTLEPCVGACSSEEAHCILTIGTETMLDAVRGLLMRGVGSGNRD
jgi:heptosyltransferase-3